ELNVIIAVENVWNKFLLSPLEFTQYVDEFASPHLKAYFDVGNIVLYGVPQDWIRTLGKRIVRVHVKGFDEKKREFVGLCEGNIDWRAVRRAFEDIGYSGWVNAELSGGDETYLTGVSECMDKIFRGE
ncbi:MAG: TIM barrel protein, partial [Candidatus Latescibacter sp.]|nr:TIM barrel protein [Candidatus Latescibacter sp.]